MIPAHRWRNQTGAPYMAKQKLFLAVITVALLSSCAYMQRAIEYSGSGGAGLPDNAVGILHYKYVGDVTTLGATVYIDEKDASPHLKNEYEYYGYAKLKPGMHRIYWGKKFSRRGDWEVELKIKVEAGRIYRLKVKSCYWCSKFRVAVWIINDKTGEVVSGKVPDWPAWWL
jgi:hypothetical protein